MYSYGSPHTAAQKQDDQHERTFSSYVRIQVVVLKTYLGRWTIGRSGEKGSGISVLPARYDDDDIYKRKTFKDYSYFLKNIYFRRPYILNNQHFQTKKLWEISNEDWENPTKFRSPNLPNPNLIFFSFLLSKGQTICFFLSGWQMIFNSCIKMHQFLNFHSLTYFMW